MISREALEAIWAKCPVCGTRITRDPDGCIQCEKCLSEIRTRDDYSKLADWWRKVGHIETWVLDGTQIQSSKETTIVDEIASLSPEIKKRVSSGLKKIIDKELQSSEGKASNDL